MLGPFTKTPKGNRYIVQVCDDYSRFGISGFSKTRSEFGPWLKLNVLKKLKGQNVNVKYLRCDNAGENQGVLKEICDEYGIELEYTALTLLNRMALWKDESQLISKQPAP